MFNLSRLFGIKKTDTDNQASNPDQIISRDKIAEILKTSPEALAAFEAAYAAGPLAEIQDDDLFSVNSRQAAQRANALNSSDFTTISAKDVERADDMTNRIVNGLLAKTAFYEYSRMAGQSRQPQIKALPAARPITNEDINALPAKLRPQLTENLMMADIDPSASYSALTMYDMYMDETKPSHARKVAYDMFRQGLDILDLNPLLYEIIGTNKNSMGYWLPKLADAVTGQDFFKIPATRIVKVPMPLLQLTRQDYFALTPTTKQIVDQWAYEAFKLDDNQSYFIKTGTYSSKFDFRNAKVTGKNEVRELGEYLLYIHFQAIQMASPLSTPSIYGASTTNEWVVREFIEDKEENPCIYKGMPLHTEYRVFIDCDTDEILGAAPYWEPDTMKSRFSQQSDADSPHQIHDYVIYKAHEDKLMARYHENLDTVLAHVREILPSIDLPGQWSLDIMQNGDDFWLIDMALAETSAFYENAVPAELRRPTPENWIPKLPEPDRD